ncbi:MAG: hypothetical protein PHP07_07180, partial [Eubacteriales bacterium]|nr:hypothetical protein [Eubacteriales bacterium]
RDLNSQGQGIKPPRTVSRMAHGRGACRLPGTNGLKGQASADAFEDLEAASPFPCRRLWRLPRRCGKLGASRERPLR